MAETRPKTSALSAGPRAPFRGRAAPLRSKTDVSLGKLGLRPGMTLLDVGCGWGATMMRAVRYDVNVVGLTLSRNQQAYVEKLFAKSGSPRSKRVLLAGWEQFREPVDRIVSIGAFEHFGFERYRRLLRDGSRIASC